MSVLYPCQRRVDDHASNCRQLAYTQDTKLQISTVVENHNVGANVGANAGPIHQRSALIAQPQNFYYLGRHNGRLENRLLWLDSHTLKVDGTKSPRSIGPLSIGARLANGIGRVGRLFHSEFQNATATELAITGMASATAAILCGLIGSL